MSNYTKLVDYAVKDGLASGNIAKLVLGSELDAEFTAIAAAIASKADGNGSVVDANKGDVTVTYSGTVWTINAGVVTLAKMANVATDHFIGRLTAATGVPEAFTLNDMTAMTDPDTTADYLMVWDGSLSAHRKMLMEYMLGIPQNAETGNYTVAMSDNGKHLYHASGAGAGDTYTIPANASVALPIGFAVTFVNLDSNSISIAITSDTLYWTSGGLTGTRTLAQYGLATALKVDSTTWIITGAGLT
jgi:hypothetical protein